MCIGISVLVMSDSVRLWNVAHQGPLSMEFSRREHLSELSFPTLGNLPDPGIEPGSPALQVDSLPSELPYILDITKSISIDIYKYVSCQTTLSSVEVFVFYLQLFPEYHYLLLK